MLLYLETNPGELLFFLLHITLNQMQQYSFHGLARPRAIEPPTLYEGIRSGNFGTMHADDGVMECDDMKPRLCRTPCRGLRESHDAKPRPVQPVRPLFVGDMASHHLPVATQPIEELLQLGAGGSPSTANPVSPQTGPLDLLFAMSRGMAVLTLRKVDANRHFTSGQQVKISRRSVKAVVLVSNLCVSNDTLLKLLFGGFTRSLPVAENPPKAILV